MTLPDEYYSTCIKARKLIIKDRAEELARRCEEGADTVNRLASDIYTKAAEIHFLEKELENIRK